MDSKISLYEQLLQRQPDHSLPQAFYKDASIYQADLENLFYREWLFAGHDCEIPEAGDYMTYKVGDYSVIIVRSQEGEINAFHNTCKHRGSRLCSKEKGNSPNLVCPYHQWTYDLDGKLKYAKDMGDDFRPQDFNLSVVHCRSMAGNMYICLADQAPDFDTFARQVEPYLLPHHLRDAKVAYESTIVENGNWKLVFENNRECYHCQGSHPELCRTYSDDPAITGVGGDGAPAMMDEHWAKCEAMGLPSRFYMDEDGQYRVARMPLTGVGESFTMDGKVATQKCLTQVDDKALGTLLLFHYPSTWNHFLSDHAITFRITPLSPTETEVTTKWLVHKDAVEGEDYDLQDLIKVWSATNDQDRQVVEENQIGVNSPAYRPGPYSKAHEGGVIQFVDWYCEFSKNALGTTSEASSIHIPALQPHEPQPSNSAMTVPFNTPLPVTLVQTEAQPAKAVTEVPQSSREMFQSLDKSRPWCAQSELLELVSVVPETVDVVTFSFRTASNNWFNFAPGQFITLELPINGQMIYRTYTISSSPSRPLSLSVTVKAQADSMGSRWLFENLKPGMQLRAFGPVGEFHLYNYPAEKYCFISAGSGITPMMSMTSYLFDRGGDPDISFIHCARKPSDIIFREGLERMSARVPSIQLSWIVNQRDAFQAWPGYVGRFNQLILELTTPDFFEREVFCCGPAPFMQAVRDILNAAGFDMNHYHEESFNEPVVEEQTAEDFDDFIPDESVPVTVNFLSSGQATPSTQATTLLESSLAVGLNIPSACKFGVCGTCKVKKVSGEVHMVHNGGISDKEVEEGYVLACCSKPIGDVDLLY